MDDSQLKTINDWYDRFVDGYRDSAGRLADMMEHKLQHSRRVADHAVAIAGRLGWQADATNEARAAGLLHDIGRFPQLKQFKSFLDHKSINHGEWGFMVLAEHKALDFLGNPLSERLALVVRHHNGISIPPDLPSHAVGLAKLIRDADKMDIFDVVDNILSNKRYDDFPELLLNVQLDGPPNPVLLADLTAGRLSAYSNIKSLADISLMQLTWLMDVNYLPTFRLIADRRVIEKIAVQLPDELGCKLAIQWAKSYLAEKLS